VQRMSWTNASVWFKVKSETGNRCGAVAGAALFFIINTILWNLSLGFPVGFEKVKGNWMARSRVSVWNGKDFLNFVRTCTPFFVRWPRFSMGKAGSSREDPVNPGTLPNLPFTICTQFRKTDDTTKIDCSWLTRFLASTEKPRSEHNISVHCSIHLSILAGIALGDLKPKKYTFS
jgi:hypothetical protein